MKPLLICLLPGLLSSFLLSAQTDSVQQVSSNIPFPPKKINNPFYHLDHSGKQTPFSIRYMVTIDMPLPPDGISFNRPNPYRPADLPVWKEIMTLAGQLAISAYADKKNLYYVSPR